ncbi:hypothetical protein TIFTF001_045258, partial [Ficus carica]
MLRDCYSK